MIKRLGWGYGLAIVSAVTATLFTRYATTGEPHYGGYGALLFVGILLMIFSKGDL